MVGITRWAGWLVVLLAACAGSAKSACELAQQKLDECGPQIAEATSEHGPARVPLEIGNDCTDPNEPTPAGSGMAQGCIVACVDR